MPANGETCKITTTPDIPVSISLPLVKQVEAEYDLHPPDIKRQRLVHGVLLIKDNAMKIVDVATASAELGIPRHVLRFTEKFVLREFGTISRTTDKVSQLLRARLTDLSIEIPSDNEIIVEKGRVVVGICQVLKSDTEKEISVTWSVEDDELGSYVFALLQSIGK